MRLDAALGSSNWTRAYLDHHLPLLLSDAGPFKGCSIKNGTPTVAITQSRSTSRPKGRTSATPDGFHREFSYRRPNSLRARRPTR